MEILCVDVDVDVVMDFMIPYVMWRCVGFILIQRERRREGKEAMLRIDICFLAWAPY